MCAGKLAPYEYPKEIEFLDSLPMTDYGKVQRRVLRLREEERKKAAALTLQHVLPMLAEFCLARIRLHEALYILPLLRLFPRAHRRSITRA